MSLRVKCPRCGRYWTARIGDSDIECTCHLICPEGSKTNDCSVTSYADVDSVKWPTGIHLGFPDDRDNQTNVNYYCSTHDYYYFKAPVLIEVDWTRLDRRAGKNERYFGGEVTP